MALSFVEGCRCRNVIAVCSIPRFSLSSRVLWFVSHSRDERAGPEVRDNVGWHCRWSWENMDKSFWGETHPLMRNTTTTHTQSKLLIGIISGHVGFINDLPPTFIIDFCVFEKELEPCLPHKYFEFSFADGTRFRSFIHLRDPGGTWVLWAP